MHVGDMRRRFSIRTNTGLAAMEDQALRTYLLSTEDT
jgi:hypothetical protein